MERIRAGRAVGSTVAPGGFLTLDFVVAMASRVPVLDGLRGLAIALVLAMHSPADLFGGALYRVTRMGWIGVDLFFVLSGFLITGILLDSKGEPGYFKSFYARRILRIFPLYYGFLAVLLLLPRASTLADWLGVSYVAEHQPWFWTHTTNWLFALEPEHAGMSSGFNRFWSLAIEEQFYLVWPLVVALTSRRQLAVVLAGLLVGGGALRLMLATHGVGIPVLYHITITRLDPLAVGAILALLARRGGLARYRKEGSLAVCGIALVALLVVGLAQWSPHREALVFAITVPAVAAAWGIVLLLTLVRESGWRECMESRPLRALGRYSYAIYLFGPVAGHLLAPNGLGPDAIGPGAYFALTTTATFLVAVGSWHLYEKRFLALRTRFPRRDTNLQPRPSPYSNRPRGTASKHPPS